MKRTVVAALVGTFVAVQCMAAEFAAPAAVDIAKAAEDTAAVGALLKGATPEQAADVVRDVIAAALGLKLEAKEQSLRIRGIVDAGMKAVPEKQQAAFAGELGKRMNIAALLSGDPALLAARLTAILNAMPEARRATFVASLGTAIGSNPNLSGNTALVSSVQRTIASVNADLGRLFGRAYREAAGIAEPPSGDRYPNQ